LKEMNMGKYVVVGGNYRNTKFDEFEDGVGESYGPFVSYDEAYVKWETESWRNVDNCHNRFEIKYIPQIQIPPELLVKIAPDAIAREIVSVQPVRSRYK